MAGINETVKGILQEVMQMFLVFSYGSTTTSWIQG